MTPPPKDKVGNTGNQSPPKSGNINEGGKGKPTKVTPKPSKPTKSTQK